MLRALIFASAFAVPLSAAAFTGGDLNKLCTKTDVASRSACAAYIEGAADGIFNTIDAIGGTYRAARRPVLLPAARRAFGAVDGRRAQIHRGKSDCGGLQREHGDLAGARQGVSLQKRKLI